MRRDDWRSWLYAGLIYRRSGWMTPPITGNPYSLSLPGQSRRQTVAMWAKYLFVLWAATFIALMGVGLIAYPITMTVRWLMLAFQ